MFELKVGNKIEELQGTREGVKFGMSDSGAELMICFSKPTNKEIEEVKAGKLQFGMFVKDSVIFILSKFGSMSWMDAPFHVALAKNLTVLQEIGEGQGYGCNIMLIDTSTGEIKALRYISFNTEFSKKLKANIEAQKKEIYDNAEYTAKLAKIFMNYSTNDMVRFSEVNCRIR